MTETFLDVEATWATFAAGEHENIVQGLRTWKLEDDLRRYVAIIEATKPEVIIEAGTKFGGSAVWFSQFGVEVVSIDIDGSYSEEARHRYPQIHWLIGDSRDPAILDCVRDLIDGRRAMVVLDSEHAAPHVADEIYAYADFVAPGCYLVVEDGIFDLVDPSLAHLGGARIPIEGGPLRAIEHALVGAAGWTRDTDIERLTTRTYHAAGFWRRDEPMLEVEDAADVQAAVEAMERIGKGEEPVPFEALEAGFGTLTIPGEEPITETPKPKAARKPKKAATSVPDPQP